MGKEPYANYTWKLVFEMKFEGGDGCPCKTATQKKGATLELVAKDKKVESLEWSTK